MKLPDPVGYYNPESGMLTSNTAMKGVLDIEWLNVFTEAQVLELLAQQEAAMNMALDAMCTAACVDTDMKKAIRALEDALK